MLLAYHLLRHHHLHHRLHHRLPNRLSHSSEVYCAALLCSTPPRARTTSAAEQRQLLASFLLSKGRFSSSIATFPPEMVPCRRSACLATVRHIELWPFHRRDPDEAYSSPAVPVARHDTTETTPTAFALFAEYPVAQPSASWACEPHSVWLGSHSGCWNRQYGTPRNSNHIKHVHARIHKL